MNEEKVVSLNEEQFESLYRCFYFLKDYCSDLIIKNGKIQQHANEESFVLFNIDLSPVTEEISFNFQNLKNTIDILKIFLGQEVDLVISDESLEFRDRFSSFTIRNSSEEYLKSKYVDDETLNNFRNVDEKDLIFDINIQKIIVNRIKVISQNFGIDNVQMIYNSENAELVAQTESMDKRAVFMKDIILNKTIDNSFSNLSLIMFRIDNDNELNLRFFDFSTESRTMGLNIVKTQLKDIEIEIYGGSTIWKNNED